MNLGSTPCRHSVQLYTAAQAVQYSTSAAPAPCAHNYVVDFTLLHTLAHLSLPIGCKPYITLATSHTLHRWEATDVWEFFRHHQSFNDAVYLWSYSWLAHLDQPSFIRDLVQALSTWNSLFFSFVRVVLFSSKLTPVAYPNPSQAKDKILIEAADGQPREEAKGRRT